MDRQQRFTEIYKTNEFKGDESISGPGSSLKNTEVLRKELVKLCKWLKVKTIVDAPCGDFNYMKEVVKELDLIEYLGIDIVPEMIEQNAKKYLSNVVHFAIGDITTYPFPNVDILICRDCLVHLSFESSFKFFRNFAKSNIPYLLTTTFTGENRKNFNFEDGRNWYPMNLYIEPFNLPQPKILINEQCQEGNGHYTDKCLGLWTLEDIKNVAR